LNASGFFSTSIQKNKIYTFGSDKGGVSAKIIIMRSVEHGDAVHDHRQVKNTAGIYWNNNYLIAKIFQGTKAVERVTSPGTDRIKSSQKFEQSTSIQM